MTFRNYFADELEGHINHMLTDLTKMIENTPCSTDEDDRNLKGRIGELVVGRAIKITLLFFGYTFDPHPIRSDFNIKRQLNSDENQMGGVDFGMDVSDSREEHDFILFEMKNWETYNGISQSTFDSKILDRFTGIDVNHENTWVVGINDGNIQYIQNKCVPYNIHIIPLMGQLTRDNISKERLQTYVVSFIRLFGTFLINNFEHIQPIAEFVDHESKKDGIIYDVIRGVPDRVITWKYGVSLQYIAKVKSEARNSGISISDKRTKDWADYKAL